MGFKCRLEYDGRGCSGRSYRLMIWFRRTAGPHHSRSIPAPTRKLATASFGSARPDLLQPHHFHCTKKWPRVSRPSSLRPCAQVFVGAIGASITDAACPEDQTTARCFDALAHDAATGAAIRIIAVGITAITPAIARTDAHSKGADLDADAAGVSACVKLR